MSDCANDSDATSASGEPRHSASASRRIVAARSGWPGPQRHLSVLHEQLEALSVELAWFDSNAIARGRRGDDVRIPQALAQARDEHLHRLRGPAGRLVAPQSLRQSFGAHGLVRMEEENGEQRAWLRATQRRGAPLVADLKRS